MHCAWIIGHISLYMLGWPISATAKLTFPRQNFLFHGKTLFLTAKLTFPRQNFISHGKTFFSTAKLSFPRQNLLFHGKTFFSTAKLTFPRQNFISHGKTFFSTAKLTFPRHNFLFHGETFFSTQGRGRTLDCAWDFFCGRMIHRKLTSHPVQKQPFSSAGGKIKIDGDSFVQLVSKMAIFFHRR